ncbi:MAG: 1,4-dihydroxy-2-naphthoate octaprenyltransferase, partial [Paludibacteraceae bacterium]|nr:1,4-dihydroxy-2-naphthoate octaprenyltransferase [Paludibacteraceae bacterium]
ALISGNFLFTPAILCLLFAITAQITANLANDYFDFKNGIDDKDRDGFKRVLTVGEISPNEMKIGTIISFILTSIIGCCLLFFGKWWMLPVGIIIVIFALAYSAGPYPLSHHGLGDIAVLIFFGIVPVTLTCYLLNGNWSNLYLSLPTSIASGLLAVNVLIVNNYRDVESDAKNNKRTTAVIFGREKLGIAYLASGIIAMLLLFPIWRIFSYYGLIIPIIYIFLHVNTWKQLIHNEGPILNGVLQKTAMNMIIFTILFLAAAIIYYCVK